MRTGVAKGVGGKLGYRVFGEAPGRRQEGESRPFSCILPGSQGRGKLMV